MCILNRNIYTRGYTRNTLTRSIPGKGIRRNGVSDYDTQTEEEIAFFIQVHPTLVLCRWPLRWGNTPSDTGLLVSRRRNACLLILCSIALATTNANGFCFLLKFSVVNGSRPVVITLSVHFAALWGSLRGWGLHIWGKKKLNDRKTQLHMWSYDWPDLLTRRDAQEDDGPGTGVVARQEAAGWQISSNKNN